MCGVLTQPEDGEKEENLAGTERARNLPDEFLIPGDFGGQSPRGVGACPEISPCPELMSNMLRRTGFSGCPEIVGTHIPERLDRVQRPTRSHAHSNDTKSL